MSSVEGVHQITRSAVAGHEVVRTDGVAFQPDTKEFCLQTVLHAVELLGQYLVQALCHEPAIAHTLDGQVLATVVHPDVHDAWIALCPTHGIGNPAATLGILNPEFADTLVGISQ